MASIEEKVEEHYKKILDELGIRHYGKTESITLQSVTALMILYDLPVKILED